ncbi:hypothetical protein ACFW2V_12365 [Streptomyces sp. NPDC058947]|uniref:hypothetical protein n=1 Tax=Streptomyces sp. NPDC058947 TaxID=3346675 RepID=UPI0036CB3D18
MIRVNARRLDLHALEQGEEVRILTGTGSVKIISSDFSGEVSTNITPTGTGERWIEEDGLKNRWLGLPSLHPRRMYRITARRVDPADSTSAVIHFRDETPSLAPVQ